MTFFVNKNSNNISLKYTLIHKLLNTCKYILIILIIQKYFVIEATKCNNISLKNIVKKTKNVNLKS